MKLTYRSPSEKLTRCRRPLRRFTRRRRTPVPSAVVHRPGRSASDPVPRAKSNSTEPDLRSMVADPLAARNTTSPSAPAPPANTGFTVRPQLSGERLHPKRFRTHRVICRTARLDANPHPDYATFEPRGSLAQDCTFGR